GNGISFAEGLRMLAGLSKEEGIAEMAAEWSHVCPSPWLHSILEELKNPTLSEPPCKSLQGTLRPYQKRGVQWLWALYRMRLGGCLADDMGLGKTVQVLSLLLAIKEMGVMNPHLL